MPLPTLLFLAFATGIAAAITGRTELRVSPRPALLSRTFAAFVVFSVLALVPVAVYFYVFHGDWFLLYLVDVRRIPSAVALLGFVVLAAVGALGFVLGAGLVRNQREKSAGVVTGLAVLGAGAVVLVAPERLRVVGSYAQYRGRFGLEPFGSGPLLQGTMVMGGLLLLGLLFLLVRIHLGNRRV
jgi:hypothetical protein